MATAPQTAMDMPQEDMNPYANPDTAAIYDQMRQTVSPKEFSDEILAGASQVDPQEVAKFKAELDKLDVPMEVLDMLNNMVDEVLANPDNYAQVKQKYEAMGVTEDLLPAEFDGHFFSALNMAVEQMIAEPAGEQAFAKGGIAELKPISKAVADYGRNGDTMLAHITPAEARMLRRKGGAGTTNPKTGLKEYFSLGKLFKSIGNAIKSFASSTVGKVVTTVALGFFLGPAAASMVGATSAAGVAAVSGFVGSAGSTLLGGGNLKDALKAGAIGGLTAGAIGGVTQGFDTAYTGPTTVGGQVDKLTGMLKAPPFPEYTARGALTDNATSNAAREAYAGNLYKTNPEAFYNPIQAPSISATGEVAGMAPTQPYPAIRPDEFGIDAQTYANTPAIDNRQFIETPANANEQVFTPKKLSVVPGPDGTLQAPPNTEIRPFTDASGRATSYGTFPTTPPADATEFPGSLAKPQGVAPPTDPSFLDRAKTFYNENISPSGIQQQGVPAAEQAGKAAQDALLARTPSATPAMLETAYQTAYKNALPGVLSTYGPMAAAGIGALALGGGFKPTQASASTLRPELMKPVTQRIAEGGNQRNYYVQGLPGVKYDQFGAPIFGQNMPLPTFETGLGITALMNPKGYAGGGLTGVSDVAGKAMTAANFDETAYLKANPDVAAAIAKGEFANAYEHYSKFGQAEGRTAFDKAETAAAAATAAAEKEAAQAANRKAVADAKAAKKAAGFTNAYQNINAGLSYDVPAGIAATAIAARQAAFKPTMDKFTQAQATNAATLAKPYTPTVVDQPYNNTTGYTNVLNPVAPPINYDTTPELSAAQKAAADKAAADAAAAAAAKAAADKAAADKLAADRAAAAKAAADKAAADKAAADRTIFQGQPVALQNQQIMDYLKANPNATDQTVAQQMDYFGIKAPQVAQVVGMQGVPTGSVQSIDARYAQAAAANAGDAAAIAAQNKANAVTDQSIRDYFAKNAGINDLAAAQYMDANQIDPAQLARAFEGTPGAIKAEDVFARYQAATQAPSIANSSFSNAAKNLAAPPVDPLLSQTDFCLLNNSETLLVSMKIS